MLEAKQEYELTRATATTAAVAVKVEIAVQRPNAVASIFIFAVIPFSDLLIKQNRCSTHRRASLRHPMTAYYGNQMTI